MFFFTFLMLDLELCGSFHFSFPLIQEGGKKSKNKCLGTVRVMKNKQTKKQQTNNKTRSVLHTE